MSRRADCADRGGGHFQHFPTSHLARPARYQSLVSAIHRFSGGVHLPILESRHIVGMRVDATTYDDATKRIMAGAKAARSAYVCASNVHMIMETYDSPKFADVINSADLVTPDGMPLVWGLRGLGVKNAVRVCGPTLTLTVCEAAARMNLPIALYGGTTES